MNYTHIKLILRNSFTNCLETYVFPVKEVRHVLNFYIDIASAKMECDVILYNEQTSDEVSLEFIHIMYSSTNSDYRENSEYTRLFRKFLKTNLIPLYPREYEVNVKDRLVHSEKLN